MALKDNCIACYQFSSATTSAVDEVGNFTQSTIEGSPTFQSTGGKVTSGYWDFTTSTADYFLTGIDYTDIGYTSGFSFVFWVKVTTTSNVAYLTGVIDSTTGPEYAQISLGMPRFASGGRYAEIYITPTANTTSIERRSSENITDGSWHFIVVTYNGTTVELLVDNVSQGTNSLTGTNNNASSIAIGTLSTAGVPNSKYFDGSISQAAFFSVALTSDEQDTLYNSGDGLAYADWDSDGGVSNNSLLFGKNI